MSGKSIILCNVKSCKKVGDLYKVSKVDGMAEVHFCICEDHYEDRSNEFVKQGFQVVKLEGSAGEMG